MTFLAIAGAALGITGGIVNAIGESRANEITQQAIEDEINLTTFQAMQRQSQVRHERAAAGETMIASAAASGVAIDSGSVTAALVANARARGQEEAAVWTDLQSRVVASRREGRMSAERARSAAWGGVLGGAGQAFGLAGTLAARR